MVESSKQVWAILMNARDTVAILIEDAPKGSMVVLRGGGSDAAPGVRTVQDIPYGHKVALRDMAEGDPVIKYGEWMGIARKAIAAGEHVHVHNVRGLNTEERSLNARG